MKMRRQKNSSHYVKSIGIMLSFLLAAVVIVSFVSIQLTGKSEVKGIATSIFPPVTNKITLSCGTCNSRGKKSLCFNATAKLASCEEQSVDELQKSSSMICVSCGNDKPTPTPFPNGCRTFVTAECAHFCTNIDGKIVCPTCTPRIVCPSGTPLVMPKPTCSPRPGCLDSGFFHCNIAEPIGGWCPSPSPITSK